MEDNNGRSSALTELSYTSALFSALRPSYYGKKSNVKEAADRALAIAAAGRSRWSRALLMPSRKRATLIMLGNSQRRRRRRHRCATSSSLRRKAKELSCLVPGCGGLPLPALVAEASDYIDALELQVRAMAAIVSALSAAVLPEN